MTTIIIQQGDDVFHTININLDEPGKNLRKHLRDQLHLSGDFMLYSGIFPLEDSLSLREQGLMHPLYKFCCYLLFRQVLEMRV